MKIASLLLSTTLLCTAPALHAQTQPRVAPSASVLTLIGPDGHSTSLSLADLEAMPQTTVRVHNAHSSRNETYEGVTLPLLLQKLNAPLGNKLHGNALAMYVVADGSDHYRALYSLAELDSDFHPGTVIVAERMDHHPLNAKTGPLKLVNTEDKRPARWVKNLVSLQLALAPPAPGSQQLEAKVSSGPGPAPARR